MSNEEMRDMQRAQVLACIHHGHELGNDAYMISIMTRIPERQVRNYIEDLRNAGHLICNRQDGRGYFLAESDEDIDRQYRQDCARAVSILRRIKPFRRAIKERDAERGDQMSFEDMVIEEILGKGEL